MTQLPSDDLLKQEINLILQNNDLAKITLRMVMTMLLERLSVTPQQLAPKKPFVRETIQQFLQSSYQPQTEEESPDPPPRVRKRKQTDPSKPVKLTGLERAVVLAEPLANFLGQPVISRSDIQKRISAYAKEKDLQDPADRRIIRCDDALHAALSVQKFTFFQLAKLVTDLVYKPDECSEELQALARECEEKAIQEKIRKREESEANGEAETKPSRGKKQKSKGDPETNKRKMTGLMKPMQLSEALIAVVGEPQLPRPEVLKKIWEYIRANELKDPNDGRRILCDQKLRAVFDGCETVTNMGINKYLSAHMTKIP